MTKPGENGLRCLGRHGGADSGHAGGARQDVALHGAVVAVARKRRRFRLDLGGDQCDARSRL